MGSPLNFGRTFALLGVGPHATATGTTLSSTPVFDLTGYTGAVAMVAVGVTATNNGLVARGGTASGSLSDLAGTWTTAHTTLLMLEVHKPVHPFINFQLRQGTSGQHGRIFVFGCGAEVLPASTGHTTNLQYKFVNAPVTGTATSS